MSVVNQLPVVNMQYVKTWMVGITAPAKKVIRRPQETQSSHLMMALTAKVNYVIKFYVLPKNHIKYIVHSCEVSKSYTFLKNVPLILY